MQETPELLGERAVIAACTGMGVIAAQHELCEHPETLARAKLQKSTTATVSLVQKKSH